MCSYFQHSRLYLQTGLFPVDIWYLWSCITNSLRVLLVGWRVVLTTHLIQSCLSCIQSRGPTCRVLFSLHIWCKVVLFAYSLKVLLVECCSQHIWCIEWNTRQSLRLLNLLNQLNSNTEFILLDNIITEFSQQILFAMRVLLLTSRLTVQLK